MKFSLFLLLGLGPFLFGCSSGPVADKDRENTIERDYIVRDASSQIRPGWTADAPTWAKEKLDGYAKYRFFSYETAPKIDRHMACSFAKAQARADIAGEIATFISQTLGSSRAGAASIDENNPKTEPLREYIEVTLAEKTQGLIHGATVLKTYWEKRQYQKAKGAKSDFVGYTCASLIRIEKTRLAKAVDEAALHVVKKASDPETKENVKKALKNVAKDFEKAKEGTL